MVAQDCYKKIFILGLACLAAGVFVEHGLPPMINYYIDKQIALTQGSLSYPKWLEPPVPIYQRFYFYNVTNAVEIEQFGQKPLLEEIGPFTYRSRWQKQEIEQNLEANTLKFKHFKQWHFEPDLSITDHSLQLVTLNAPLAVTLTLIQSASNAVRLLVTLSLDGLSEGFFTKRSVKQLLFEGYPDLLTTFGPLLNAEMLSQGGHFGYMNARNNTVDGVYEINTGADDISKLNTIHKYNGRSRLPYWGHHNHGGHGAAAAHASSGAAAAGQVGSRCDSLEGATTGEMFPPIMSSGGGAGQRAAEDGSGGGGGGNQSSSLRLFQPDFCRVWRLNLDGKYEGRAGLKLSRFKASRDIFRNSSDLRENACYFTRHHTRQSQRPSASAASQAGAAAEPPATGSGGGGGNSVRPSHNHNSKVRHEWPAGVFTLAPCKFNAPIYMSMPHFLDADPYFSSQVDGMQPDPMRHEFYVDLEPRTGSPVTLAARVQLNVAISKPPGLVRFRNIPEIMFPVFWQELTVNLTGPVIDELLLASRANTQTIKVSYVLYLLGAAVLTTAALFCLHLKIVAPFGASNAAAAAASETITAIVASHSSSVDSLAK